MVKTKQLQQPVQAAVLSCDSEGCCNPVSLHKNTGHLFPAAASLNTVLPNASGNCCEGTGQLPNTPGASSTLASTSGTATAVCRELNRSTLAGKGDLKQAAGSTKLWVPHTSKVAMWDSLAQNTHTCFVHSNILHAAPPHACHDADKQRQQKGVGGF
jgi:hypothetical protein